jgi:D-serine deaminase-like pyridoxal phosphate-dependent protein
MQTTDDLPTPAVLIDLDVLEKNVARMQERARAAGVKLRPHAKTHKSPEVGRLQLSAGAVGLTLAKTSEAEVFAAQDFEDIFLGYPIVGADKARRLLALSDRFASRSGPIARKARGLSRTCLRRGPALAVRLKVDCGYGRVGVPPERVVETALAIAALSGLEFQGLFTHGGQGYGATTPEEAIQAATDEGRAVAEAAEAVRAAGLPVAEVSLGSTPAASRSIGTRGITECRPGTYVYNDFSQVNLGSCRPEDCAMTVLSTIVSVPAAGRAVADAGSKTLSTDPLRPTSGGHGLVLGTSSRLARLSEEHGVIAVEPGDAFRVGQRIRILPNHACIVSNLHDRLIAVRSGRVEGQITVAARGCVQ